MSMAAQVPSRRDAPTGSIKPRVLIVEDETALVELLRYNLEQSGFRVSVAYDGEEALASVQEDVPDLILLDWMLPLMSGIEVCRQLRRQTATAQPADHHADGARRGGRSRARPRCRRRRLCLQAVLADRAVARIRAVLRRIRPALADEALSYADIVMDLVAHRVTRAGKPVHLGPTEFRLLRHFMEHPGRVFSREQLARRGVGQGRLCRGAHRRRAYPPAAHRAQRRAAGRPDPHRARRGLCARRNAGLINVFHIASHGFVASGDYTSLARSRPATPRPAPE